MQEELKNAKLIKDLSPKTKGYLSELSKRVPDSFSLPNKLLLSSKYLGYKNH